MELNILSMSTKGFSLMELIVVIIILGVVSTISLPIYFSWVEKCRASEAILALESLKAIVEPMFYKYGYNADPCAGQTEPLTGAFHTVLYQALDAFPQLEYFLLGTAADNLAGKPTAGCSAGHVLWIDAFRKDLGRGDPCAGGNNSQCVLQGCGEVWGNTYISGISMCRNISGAYGYVGMGVDYGAV
jgi:prepilin-type N-terminal cleavage/methylation domain-containing protein